MIKRNQDPSEEFIRELQPDQVQEALEQLGHDVPCTTCGHRDHTIAYAANKPCIIEGTLVSHDDGSLWFYALICAQCGHTRLVNAVTVAEKAMETVADEEK